MQNSYLHNGCFDLRVAPLTFIAYSVDRRLAPQCRNPQRRVEDSIINLYVGEKAGLIEVGAKENVNASLSLLASSVASLVSEVSGLRSTLNETLTSNKDNLLLSATVAIERLNRINTTVGLLEENIVYADSMIKSAAPYRWTTLLTLFIVSLVSVFSGVVGVIAYFTPFAFDDYLISLLNLTFFLSGFICSAALILGSLTFSATLVAGDTCKMIDLATADFEPYLGSFAGEAAGLCFTGGNFTKTLNLEEHHGYISSRRQIDYASGKVTEFDEQVALSGLEAETAAVAAAAVGLTSSEDFGSTMTSLLSMSALVSSNDYDSTTKYSCPFDFPLIFDTGSPLKLLEPWEYATSEVGKSGNTGWKEMEFEEIPYARQSSEAAEDYIARIFGVAGRCTGGADEAHPKLCWQGWTRNVIPMDPTEFCTGGGGCEYPCQGVTRDIRKTFNETVRLIRVRHALEVGVADAESEAGKLKGNLTSSRTDAANMEVGVVGELLGEVRGLECNGQCLFVRELYNNVKEEMCLNATDAMSFVWISLVILAGLSGLNGGLTLVLVVRMRGESKVDIEPVFEKDGDEEVDGKGLGENVDLYA